MTIVVTGGVDYDMTAADFLHLKVVLKLCGARNLVTEPAGKVADAVREWAVMKDIPVMRGHPESGGESRQAYSRRNAALLYLADVIVAFPGTDATTDLL